MADKNYKLIFQMSDGTSREVGFVSPQGPAGVDGKTPVKGVDYYTESDKNEIVESVRSQISIEVPYFDLVGMGLPTIPYDGSEVSVTVDTTSLIDALDNGLVKVKISLGDASGSEPAFGFVLDRHVDGAGRHCTVTANFGESIIDVTIWVNDGNIKAAINKREPDVFPVTINISNSSITASHTPSEITSAHKAGKFVYATDAAGSIIAMPISLLDDTCLFAGTFGASNEDGVPLLGSETFIVSSDKTVTQESVTTIPVPVPSETDTGKVLTAGGNGAAWTEKSIPVFNIVTTNAIPLDGTRVSYECDTSELRSALEDGLVKVNMNIDLLGATHAFTTNVRAQWILDESYGSYQSVFISYINDKSYQVKFDVDSEQIGIAFTEISVVPSPTSEDYGKVLSASTTGLYWTTAESLLESAEGVGY